MGSRYALAIAPQPKNQTTSIDMDWSARGLSATAKLLVKYKLLCHWLVYWLWLKILWSAALCSAVSTLTDEKLAPALLTNSLVQTLQCVKLPIINHHCCFNVAWYPITASETDRKIIASSQKFNEHYTFSYVETTKCNFKHAENKTITNNSTQLRQYLLLVYEFLNVQVRVYSELTLSVTQSYHCTSHQSQQRR